MADVSRLEQDRGRGWWLSRLVRDEQGEWDLTVQFIDGHALELHLLPSRDLDLVIAQAVNAHLTHDVRWSKRSDRGGG